MKFRAVNINSFEKKREMESEVREKSLFPKKYLNGTKNPNKIEGPGNPKYPEYPEITGTSLSLRI